MMLNIQKNKDETISEFCYRLYSLKDEYGFTWEDITDIVNKNSGTNFTINAVKKRFYRARTEGLPSGQCQYVAYDRRFLGQMGSSLWNV